jgi:predicted acylesterase/phospholipase RssA
LGLTLIQRSSGFRPPRNPKIALVLAGGAVTGGAFKVGGLKALDECLEGRKVNDFDIYVGLSAGAFLATSLAQGITPDEMIEALEGTSVKLSQLRPIDFYRPNVSLDDPNYTRLEALLMAFFQEVSPKRQFPPLSQLLPSGLFDNSALERWLESNIAAVGGKNSFAELFRESGKKLFIAAANLDTAERVVFGPDHDHGLTISQAVRASSALPGFFRPARINGIDYVDGGIQRTANIDVAVEQGADLVICYNPFRPFLNVARGPRGRKYLADRGFNSVISQVFRTLLHTRLALGLQSYLHSDRFRGDIVVIEARESDEQFFDTNPMAFWQRSDAIRHGFDSVRRTLSEHADVLGPLFETYGLDVRIPEHEADQEPEPAPEAEDSPVPVRLHSVS